MTPVIGRLRLADAIIESLDIRSSSQSLTEDSLYKLQDIFPETLILAALDLVDQRKVTENLTPWGFTEYEVLGSNATHIVSIGLAKTLITSYCTCPAFNLTVLEIGQSLICKHVLATRLAIRLDLVVKQSVSLDYIAGNSENLYWQLTRG